MSLDSGAVKKWLRELNDNAAAFTDPPAYTEKGVVD
jgi:hypothetical protein